jgi:hypothetical protein
MVRSRLRRVRLAAAARSRCPGAGLASKGRYEIVAGSAQVVAQDARGARPIMSPDAGGELAMDGRVERHVLERMVSMEFMP